MAPIAGAQYRECSRKPIVPRSIRNDTNIHFPDWVSEFAPDKYQKFLSYLTGYVNILSKERTFAHQHADGSRLLRGKPVTLWEYSLPAALCKRLS